jgi:hypothetical protein
VTNLTSILPAMSLAVVGAPYDPKRKFEILLCAPGEPIELVPEPKNKHDENAIAVFSARGVQLGYLTAERAPRISQLIRQGREVTAVFQAASSFGAWIRVAFDGEEPVPPEQREWEEPIEPEGGWFPDEVWPDD